MIHMGVAAEAAANQQGAQTQPLHLPEQQQAVPDAKVGADAAPARSDWVTAESFIELLRGRWTSVLRPPNGTSTGLMPVIAPVVCVLSDPTKPSAPSTNLLAAATAVVKGSTVTATTASLDAHGASDIDRDRCQNKQPTSLNAAHHVRIKTDMLLPCAAADYVSAIAAPMTPQQTVAGMAAMTMQLAVLHICKPAPVSHLLAAVDHAVKAVSSSRDQLMQAKGDPWGYNRHRVSSPHLNLTSASSRTSSTTMFRATPASTLPDTLQSRGAHPGEIALSAVSPRPCRLEGDQHRMWESMHALLGNDDAVGATVSEGSHHPLIVDDTGTTPEQHGSVNPVNQHLPVDQKALSPLSEQVASPSRSSRPLVPASPIATADAASWHHWPLVIAPCPSVVPSMSLRPSSAPDIVPSLAGAVDYEANANQASSVCPEDDHPPSSQVVLHRFRTQSTTSSSRSSSRQASPAPAQPLVYVSQHARHSSSELICQDTRSSDSDSEGCSITLDAILSGHNTVTPAGPLLPNAPAPRGHEDGNPINLPASPSVAPLRAHHLPRATRAQTPFEQQRRRLQRRMVPVTASGLHTTRRLSQSSSIQLDRAAVSLASSADVIELTPHAGSDKIARRRSVVSSATDRSRSAADELKWLQSASPGHISAAAVDEVEPVTTYSVTEPLVDYDDARAVALSGDDSPDAKCDAMGDCSTTTTTTTTSTRTRTSTGADTRTEVLLLTTSQTVAVESSGSLGQHRSLRTQTLTQSTTTERRVSLGSQAPAIVDVTVAVPAGASAMLASASSSGHQLKPPSGVSGNTHTNAVPIARFKVLVAEDNLVNQKVARLILTRLGCEVHVANNGLEAVRMVTDDVFDLVFMDCFMPEMDGYEATRRIRDLMINSPSRPDQSDAGRGVIMLHRQSSSSSVSSASSVSVADGGELIAFTSTTASSDDRNHVGHVSPASVTHGLNRPGGGTSRGRLLPIIALTAACLPMDKAKCYAVGMDDVVSKPVNILALQAALRRWAPAERDSVLRR